MIHEMKYKGRKDIGIKLGEMMGRDLIKSDFKEVDVIVPVPLHKRKKRKRGYNQAELIAEGLVRVMSKPVDKQTLFRVLANPTQTKKHKYERWENVQGIFQVKNYFHLENKHILLVDDIITTGATLESSAAALLEIPGVKVSIAVVGMA
jgi:ComF family protein